jgi:transglutaminase-like putative cysteine protease
MREELATNPQLTPTEKLELSFEIERLERIKKDFNQRAADILYYIQQYVPSVTVKDLEKWEKEKSLEFMIIDSEKRYFEKAASNLFRINKGLKKIKELQKKKSGQDDTGIYNRIADIEEIIGTAKTSGNEYVKPTKVRITYSITVKENAVPEGKIIRAWLPFPREIANRQDHIKIISTEPNSYLLTGHDDYSHRSIYFETFAIKDKPVVFKTVFEFTTHAFYREMNPKFIKPVTPNEELKPYLQERPPHIIFNNELKTLALQIAGKETNPYKIAQRIFYWINEHIPWALAREYSTIPSISKYAYENRHGDCGIKTILFITLCRINGIPAKWESGWTTTPVVKNMHDWGEIYFSPYGWMPVDVSFGVNKSKDDAIKWFYLGNIDSYRFIVNTDFSRELFPAKIYPRSDTVDFQRGELEWEDGNLYFDQWNWNYQVEYLK